MPSRLRLIQSVSPTQSLPLRLLKLRPLPLRLLPLMLLPKAKLLLKVKLLLK